MQSLPVVGEMIPSKILLVGQAPGIREPALGRPFAWTAGKKLFEWLACIGLPEDLVRRKVYFAAVCRCFPGKAPSGGDRAPRADEIENCRVWLDSELELLRPQLIIAVGKLAITQFVPCPTLAEVVGRAHQSERSPKSSIIPLPHPSGASTWIHTEPGRTLLRSALKLLAAHPLVKGLSAN